ncbi:MAG: beta-ketoacyl-[acyl-carrier-protein] synthase family protein, partial [Thermoanaerobaculia bacterium]|nr:beta-ketoacyl-[acyl-carrier-protein] synthase family protein [Thermoanaerobaculia bacterium]
VVTGVGVVTSLGCDRDTFWARLLAGTSGLGPVESFDTSAYSVHLGGEVRDFSFDDCEPGLDLAEVGRASAFAVVAARRALADAGIDAIDARRAGVSAGTTSGEPREIEAFDDALLAGELASIGPRLATRYPCHSIPATVAAALGFTGPNVMIPTACAAGSYAAANALDCLRAGQADLMLAGGSDSFSRITYTGFARLGAIAPEKCQPFDLNRRGMVPGEGAAMLVLERAEQALARGVPIYAEITGYGLSCDAHHMTGAHPEGDGAARAMRAALRDSGLGPEDVGYVSAHGTGTPSNDRTETLALKSVFGERAYDVPVSSIKSMLGHTMGAASAIETVACALALRDGRIPPTIDYETPDPDCDLDYVPNEAREVAIRVAMNNAYAFGGNNASLILTRWEGQA